MLPITALGDEMHALLKMGAIRGLSIGYRVDEADYNSDGVRLLKQVDLWEVSLVSLPMNPAATVDSVKHGSVDAKELLASVRSLNERLALSILKR